MQKLYIVILLGFLAVILGACSISPEGIVTPAPDKLTLMFFYTDG